MRRSGRERSSSSEPAPGWTGETPVSLLNFLRSPSSTSLFHGAHGADKGAHLSGIFLAGLAFDASGNVHAPGVEEVNSLLHIGGMQAAGDYQLTDAVDDPRPGLDPFPIESV